MPFIGLAEDRLAIRCARGEGMTSRKSSTPISTSSVHKTLHSRIYAGGFDWLEKRYQES